MTYAAWLATLDSQASAHELSYDAAAVRRLAAADRARAEDEIARRATLGDALAFETAGQLGLSGVIPALEGYRAAGGPAGAAAARALFLLRGDALESAPGSLEAGLDAFTLRSSDRPDAIELLFGYLTDPGVHARVHASEGLIARLGLSAEAARRGSPLSRLELGVSNALLWPEASVELRSALETYWNGGSLADAGLAYTPSADPEAVPRFFAQVQRWQPIDLDNIRGMSRDDRAWAEAVLIAGLVGGNVNRLIALRALDTPGWRSYAQAALPGLDRLIGAPGQVEAIRAAYERVLSGG